MFKKTLKNIDGMAYFYIYFVNNLYDNISPISYGTISRYYTMSEIISTRGDLRTYEQLFSFKTTKLRP